MRTDAIPTIRVVDDYELASEHDTEPPLPALPLGKPARKPHFEKSHAFATTLSWICFLASCVTIAPQLRLAWLLRYEGQIVVIGFLLGVMNLCTSTVIPQVLLLLERRFGRSSLQNYEALLQSRPLSPGASFVWRFIMAFFVGLPLGLSVVYKRFLGGMSTAEITMPSSEVSSVNMSPQHHQAH